MPKAPMRENIVALLRVMHAGVPVRVLPKGQAMYDMSMRPKGVRRATLEALFDQGLVAFDAANERYTITDAGRDEVRVWDGVEEFIADATT